MPKIKITGTPEMQMGGNTKRVRITGTPDMNNNTVMANGGYANQGATRKYGDQQTGQGYALDRFWASPAGYPGSTSKINPYAKTGNTLPEAKDGGDINAEKQEMVLGDFDQDGQQELMNVNGKPHTEGGKDINVPSNSFVFSDTKALRIKDPNILAMFNMKPRKGGYTPAEVAKKYDLNKLKRILDDPKADEFSKKTAQLMNDNYLAKLNKLAAVQEGMKKQMGMDHHDPNQPKGQQQSQQQEPEVQEAGNMGPGGQNMMQPEVMAKYGGEIPKYQYAGIGPRTDEEDPNTVANQQVSQSVPPVYNMYSNNDAYPDDVQRGRQMAFNSTNTEMYSNNNNLDPNSRLNRRSQVTSSYPGVTPPLSGPITNAGSLYDKPLTKDENDQLFNNSLQAAKHNPNFVRGKDYGSDYTPFELMKPILRAKGVPENLLTEEGYPQWVTATGGDAAQLLGTGPMANKPGVRWERYIPAMQLGRQQDQMEQMSMLGLIPFPTSNEQGSTPYPVTPPSFDNTDNGTWTGNTLRNIGKGIKNVGKGIASMQMNPNFYGDMQNLLQMANLKKFKAYEPPVQAVIPETVFADYTAQAAAAQEAARVASEGDVGATGRAMSLARQGESLKPVREAIANTQAQNVGIANAANSQAAQITNDLMAKQSNRLAELNKAGFLADRDYQREMGKLQAEYTDRMQKHHEDDVKTAWLNKTSEYFDIGPGGYPKFKPGMEEKYFRDIQKGGNSNLPEQIKALMRENNWSFDEAFQAATGNQGTVRTQTGKSGNVEKTTVTKPATGQYGGYQMRYGGSHMAMPQMAPQYQTGGAYLPHYQIGGSFVPAIAGSTIEQMPDFSQDNTRYQQPVQNEIAPIKRGKGVDIATATNNPGNIIYRPTFAKKFGAVDSGIKQTDGSGHFAAFPDLATGFKAYQTQLFGDTDGIMSSKYYKADTPVDKALRTWSGKGYGAEIYPEIKGKTLGELTMAERAELAKRQIKRESGSVYNLLRQRGVFKYGGNALQKFIK